MLGSMVVMEHTSFRTMRSAGLWNDVLEGFCGIQLERGGLRGACTTSGNKGDYLPDLRVVSFSGDYILV